MTRWRSTTTSPRATEPGDPERPEVTLERLEHSVSTFLGRRFKEFCERHLRRSYSCIETRRWWRPSKELDENGRPMVVDIDVTARVESDGSVYDVFGECMIRRRQTGFAELNTLTGRVGFTGANVNLRYVLFSPSGFMEDLRDYAESRRDTMLVDLSMLMGDTPPRPLRPGIRT